jgi:hypothetical protein
VATKAAALSLPRLVDGEKMFKPSNSGEKISPGKSGFIQFPRARINPDKVHFSRK